MKMRKFSVVSVLLLLAMLILLGFIAGKIVGVPKQENAPTQTYNLEATDIPTQTATPLPTISPVLQVPLSSPPSGLLYESGKVLLYIDNQNHPVVLFEIPKENTVSVSHDGGSAILSSFAGDNGYAISIVNFSKNSQIDLNPGENYSFCGVMRWPEREDILLAYLEPKEYSGGMDCDAVSAIISIKTQEFEFIGTKAAPGNIASISSSGMKVAFGNAGEPWIYLLGTGSVIFDPLQYDFPLVTNGYFSNPSWSPSERYLAWVISGTMNGDDVEGIGVFDTEQNTSRFYYPYQVRGYDIRSSIIWNPDEQNITLVNRTLHTQWIITLDEGESTVLAYIPVWNPVGDKFAHLEYDRNLDQAFIVINEIDTGQTYKIILPLESEIRSWLNDSQIAWESGNILYWDEHGQKLMWSLDGKYLVVGTGDETVKWNWLVDMDNLNLYRLDLPEYAKIYKFIETEK